MALKRDQRYPGRFSTPTTAHPQGAFKDRTSPTAQDGSYMQADWANDWDGFFSSLLAAAGITANGNVDGVGASQYFSAAQSIFAAKNGNVANDFAVRNSGDVNNAVNNARLSFVLNAYASLNGNAAQPFAMSNSGTGSNGVNNDRLNFVLQSYAGVNGNQFTPFNVGGATAGTQAVRLDQFQGGNNVNGAWVKFPAGAQWCRTNLTLAANATTTWTYPLGFISSPGVYITAINGAFQAWLNGVSSTSANIYNNGPALNVNLLAIY